MSIRSSPRQAGRRPGGAARTLLLAVATALGLGLAVAGTGLVSPAPAARAAVAGAGPTVDTLDVIATVSIESILGAETIQFSGSTTMTRSAPRIEGGVIVTDVEVISLDLTGMSVTGPVVLRQSPTLVSLGEVRGLQPSPDQFPASSFIDLFFEADVPASPGDPLTLHNEQALHLVPVESGGGTEVPLTAWPPVGVPFRADPDPCKPKLPVLPAEVCVTSASFFVGGVTTPTPTPTITPTQSVTPTPTPTPLPVGGIAELPDVAGTPLAASGASRANAGLLVAIAVAGTLALGGAAWYARVRWRMR